MKLDLTTLITQKGIPIGLTHLDSFVRAKQYSHTFKSSFRGTPISTSCLILIWCYLLPAILAGAYYDLVGTHVHPATHSRDKEVRYVHDLTRRLLPFLTPKNSLKCVSLKAFLNDLLAGAVLQPVIDVLADPDIINYILQVFASRYDTGPGLYNSSFLAWHRLIKSNDNWFCLIDQFRRPAHQSFPATEWRDGRVAGKFHQCFASFNECEVGASTRPFRHSQEPAGPLRLHAVPERRGRHKPAAVLSLHW